MIAARAETVTGWSGIEDLALSPLFEQSLRPATGTAVLPTIAPQPFGAVCDNVDSVRLPVSRAALLCILPGKQLCLHALQCIALPRLLRLPTPACVFTEQMLEQLLPAAAASQQLDKYPSGFSFWHFANKRGVRSAGAHPLRQGIPTAWARACALSGQPGSSPETPCIDPCTKSFPCTPLCEGEQNPSTNMSRIRKLLGGALEHQFLRQVSSFSSEADLRCGNLLGPGPCSTFRCVLSAHGCFCQGVQEVIIHVS